MSTIEMREEQFAFEDMPVTVYRGGAGAPLLMIHGSGPGASSIGNWRTVLPALAARYDLYAMDLIGFGKSARKPSAPFSTSTSGCVRQKRCSNVYPVRRSA